MSIDTECCRGKIRCRDSVLSTMKVNVKRLAVHGLHDDCVVVEVNNHTSRADERNTEDGIYCNVGPSGDNERCSLPVK